MRRRLLAVVLAVGCVAAPTLARSTAHPFAPHLSEAALESDALTRLLPPATLAVIEAPGLSAFLEQGLEQPLVARLLDSELGRALTAEAPMSPQEGLAAARVLVGFDVLPALASACDEGLVVGVGVKRGQASFLLVARGSDGDATRLLLERALTAAAAKNGVEPGALVRPQGNVRGADAWFLDERLALAVDDGLLFVASDEGLLRDAIDRHVDGQGESVDANASFRAARECTAERAPLVWGWIDWAAIEAVNKEAVAGWRALAHDPRVQFLLGPAVAAAGAGRASSIGLVATDARLELFLESDGLEETAPTSVLFDADGSAPVRVEAAPDAAAQGRVYRDLAGVFRERARLFAPEALPSFSEALSNLALLFGGEDVGETLFPALSPWIELYVEEPRFEARPVPDVRLPAAALIADLRDAARVGPKLVGAFQTLIGILNVESAQQRRPQLVLGLELLGDVPLTAARFPAPPSGAGVDLRYNLEPACAQVGERFVLGTNRALVADLVARLQASGAALESAGRAAGERLSVAGAAVARLLRANADALAMDAVLKKGKTLERAREEVARLALAGDLVERLTWTSERPDPGRVRVALALELAR